ncbi:hypothetical protein KAU11_01655 [Candidatus Babeliales bacterium]|nr:hypothetical protein [Candidatus Babeliales bacterium]
MKKRFLGILLSIALLSASLVGIVFYVFMPKTTLRKFDRSQNALIIVHGTFAADAEWFKPGGPFYDHVKETLIDKKTKIIPLMWSGNPTTEARLDAAYSLAKIIIKLTPENNISIIAHSHGGNVANLASSFLELAVTKDRKKIAGIAKHLCNLAFDEHITGKTIIEALASGKEQQDKLAKVLRFGQHAAAGTSTLFKWINISSLNQSLKNFQKKVGSLATTLEMCSQEDEDPTYKDVGLIENRIKNICDTLRTALHNSGIFNLEETLVDKAYLMACPVNEEAYRPSTHVIENVYNIYSHGDVVQRVLGVYKRTFSKNKAIKNISISVKPRPQDQTVSYLGHAEFDTPFIGKWLLTIPELVTHFQHKENGVDLEFYKDFSRPQVVTNPQLFNEYRPERTLVAKSTKRGKLKNFVNPLIENVLNQLKKLV